jgi:hypothetical protein
VRTDRALAALDRQWRRLVLGLWSLAPVTLGVGILLGAWGTVGLWAPPVGCVVAGLGGLWAAVDSRRLTPRGAAELNRWLAFKRYLLNVPPRDLREVGRRFDEYLPYALALFADAVLIEQLRRGRIPVRVPGWYTSAARPVVSAGDAAHPGRPGKERHAASRIHKADDLDFDVKPSSGRDGTTPGSSRDDAKDSATRDLPGAVEDVNRGLVASVESFNSSLAGMITATSIAFAGVTQAGGGSGDSSFSGSAALASDYGGFSSSDFGSSGSSSDSGAGGGGSSDTF